MIKYLLYFDMEKVNLEEVTSIISFFSDRGIDIIALPKTYQLIDCSKEELQNLQEVICETKLKLEMFDEFKKEDE